MTALMLTNFKFYTQYKERNIRLREQIETILRRKIVQIDFVMEL